MFYKQVFFAYDERFFYYYYYYGFFFFSFQSMDYDSDNECYNAVMEYEDLPWSSPYSGEVECAEALDNTVSDFFFFNDVIYLGEKKSR